MAICVAPQLVPLFYQHTQVLGQENCADRCFLTHEAKRRVVGSCERVTVQNGATCKQSRAREIVESKRDQRDTRVDRKWPFEKQAMDIPPITAWYCTQEPRKSNFLASTQI